MGIKFITFSRAVNLSIGFMVGRYVRLTPAQAGGGGGVLPFMGYIGMCGPKRYGFSAVLVINRASNLADSGH